MRRLATALTMLVVVASIAPSAAAAGIAPATDSIATVDAKQTSGEAYAGSHVSFDASQRAVTDYAVDGETMFDSLKVQSKSEVEERALVDLGASLSTVTRVEGAGLSVAATTETEARVRAENGATVAAHDNSRGVLVVASGNQSDVVVANLSAGASASAESDAQVEVTTANGTEGTFLVVGEGNVTVNDEGNVTARLGEDGRLVFRSYPDGKDDGDEKQEEFIAEGTAKAEAYVMADGESGSSGQMVVDTVSYGQNTTVEVEQTAEGKVALTVNRTTHEGTVLVTSVSEEALNASGGLNVTVDGEAAVEASTYSQLKSAIGSDRSRYAVRGAGSGSAEASADVLVAVNHFSERTVAMQSASGESASETTTEDGTSGETTSDESTSDDQTTEEGTTGDETTTSADETTTGDGTAPAGTTAGDGTTVQGNDDATQGGDASGDSSGSIPGFTPVTAVVALLAAALLARVR